MNRKEPRCPFCDGLSAGHRTKEDVVPQWVIREFGLDKDHILATHFSETGDVLSDRLYGASQIVLGRVCADCNSGWMSNLETRNKIVITKLARSRLDILDLNDVEAMNLALWAFKTALALHAASNYRRLVPKDHYQHLATQCFGLPAHVFVAGKNWPLANGFRWVQSPSWWIHQQERELTSDETKLLRACAYKICFQLCHLLLLVAFNPIPSSRFLLWQYMHVPLWPRSGPVSWLQKPLELPSDNPFSALVVFHGSVGLVPL